MCLVKLVPKIVEAEAYGGDDDPASHTFKATPKSKPMFGKAGLAYIVSIHGHGCFNTTTERPGTPRAVLIRAVKPIGGIDNMKRNRKSKDLRNLTNDPGKLVMAPSRMSGV